MTIALIRLDSARHCLHRMTAGGGHYVCRRQHAHDGPHDYLPIDIIVVAEPATPFNTRASDRPEKQGQPERDVLAGPVETGGRGWD